MRKVTYLKLWIMPIGRHDTSLIIGKEIENFEKLYPHIKIDLSVIPWWQAWKRIIRAAKSRQLPDIFQIGNTWTKTLTAINALADITKRVESDNLKNKFHAAVWTTCEVGDFKKVCALPWSEDARMLFYRKDIFDKVGISPKDIDDWGTFKEACRKLTGFDDGTGPIGALGISDIKDFGLIHDLAPWIWSGGGDFLTQDGTKSYFQNSESLRGIKFYFDLIQNGYAPVLDRKVPSYPVYDFFVSGKYAMCIPGAFFATDYLPGFFERQVSHKTSEKMKKFGVTFLPAGPEGRFAFLGGTNLAISNYSLNQDAAWLFLNFLTSKDFQIRQYEAIGMTPSRIEAFDSLFGEETEPGKILIETYKNFGRSYRQVDSWASIEFILAELFGNIIDAIKARRYNHNFLTEETNKFAEHVNYILSL